MSIINVCLSGAAGNIAHSLYNSLGNGEVFGKETILNLRLLELPQKIQQLKILLLELEDCCFKYLKTITIHSNPDQAFQDLDFAILLGGSARKPGMERRDLFQLNRKVFEQQGRSLNVFAKKTCKILVVANPANTNCLTLAKNAPTLEKKNFTCLMRLDYNRSVSQIAIKLNCMNTQIKKVVIWGNHSTTQFPDLTQATYNDKKIVTLVDKTWIQNDFISIIQKRGGKILTTKGVSSSISAANAIKDHIVDWRVGSKEIVSMGVLLEQEVYGIPKDLCMSLGTICKGNYVFEIIKNLQLNDFQKKKIGITVEQLIKQRSILDD